LEVRDERGAWIGVLEGKCAFVEFLGWEWLKKAMAFDLLVSMGSYLPSGLSRAEMVYSPNWKRPDERFRYRIDFHKLLLQQRAKENHQKRPEFRV
jgi:hypothetical protein